MVSTETQQLDSRRMFLASGGIGLGDLVKEAERALDRARFAVIDAKAGVARADRSRKAGPARTNAIDEARLACKKAKDAEAVAQCRVDKFSSSKLPVSRTR